MIPYFDRYGKNAKEFIALLAVSIILNIGFGILVPFIPTFGLKIGATAVQIGYIISGFMIGRMISAPNAGALSDKIGRRQVMIAGTLIYAIVTSAMAFSNNWIILFIFRIIEGMAVGSVWPTAQAHLVDIVPKEKIGEATGLYSASFSLGFFIGPLTGSAVYYLVLRLGGNKNTAIISPFLATGFLATLSLIGLILFVHNVSQFRQQTRKTTQTLGEREEKIIPYQTEKGFYGDSFNYSLEYKKFYLISFINGIGVGIIIPIFAIYFVDQLKVDEGLIGVVIGIGGAIAMSFNPIGGALADRKGRKNVMYFGLLFMATGTFLIGFAPTLLIGAILYFTRQFGFGFFFPSLRAQQADVILPFERGKIFGRIQLAFNTGGLLGPVIGTFLYQTYSNQIFNLGNIQFLGAALPFAATGILSYLMLLVVQTLHIPRKNTISTNQELSFLEKTTPTITEN